MAYEIFSHSPADVIRWLLVQLGQGSDPTLSPLQPWPVYASSEPNEPDDVLTVYDTTPQGDGRIMLGGMQQVHWGVQVRVRSTIHVDGWKKAKGLEAALSEEVAYTTVNVGAVPYVVYAVSTSSVLVLGKEQPSTRRSLFTCNFVTAIDGLIPQFLGR
jgi:hypothetical protein